MFVPHWSDRCKGDSQSIKPRLAPFVRRGIFTSEAFTHAIQKVDLAPYIDEIQAEVSRALKESNLRDQAQVDAEFEKLAIIISKQTQNLAKDLHLSGDPIFVHMLTGSVVLVAWTAFAVRRASMDDKRPFDVRLDLVEMSSGLGNALSEIVSRSASYAENYAKKT